jgi:cell division protein FtsB
MRRVLATLCIGVLAILVGYKAAFGPNGMMVYRAKKAQYQKLQQDIEREQAENDRLQRQVNLLQTDRNTIINEARTQLGYVMPGDIVLLEPQPKLDAKLPVPPPISNAKK